MDSLLPTYLPMNLNPCPQAIPPICCSTVNLHRPVEDEVALMEAHVEEGNKWSSIAKRIPGGRSHLDVKVCVCGVSILFSSCGWNIKYACLTI